MESDVDAKNLSKRKRNSKSASNRRPNMIELTSKRDNNRSSIEKQLIMKEILRKIQNLNASAKGDVDLQRMARELKANQAEDAEFDAMVKEMEEEKKREKEEDEEEEEDEEGDKKSRRKKRRKKKKKEEDEESESEKSDDDSKRKKKKKKKKKKKLGEKPKWRQFHFDREEITTGFPRIKINETCRYGSFIFMFILNALAIGPQVHVTIKSIDIGDFYRTILATLDGPDTYVMFDYFTLAMSLGVALHTLGFFMCLLSIWVETRSYFLLGLPFYSSLLLCTTLYCAFVVYACYEWAKHLEHGIAWPLEIMLRNYYTNESQEIMMNFIQQKFHCCGVTSYQDWLSDRRSQQIQYDYYVAYHERIPSSCCDSNYDDRCIIYHEYIEEAKEDIFEGVGINMVGCEGILRKELLNLFQTYMFYELMVIIICDFFLVIFTRFLSTSINNAFRLEVPEVTTYGYGILLWYPEDPITEDSDDEKPTK